MSVFRLKPALFYFGVIALFAFSSCGEQTGIAGKCWFYTHSTGVKDRADTLLNPASFIVLEKDGRYTRDFGHFDYGQWVYQNKQILLTSSIGNKSVIPVNYLTAKEMQTGPARGPFDNFESQPGLFTAPASNPFSIENNLWRVKATGPEDAAQLRRRLINHFKFWELYLTWALDNNIQYIDVRSTPTPVKIYGNGFGLKPGPQLPASWKNYFYDEADCTSASEKIKYLFDNNAIAWPHTENKYKMFISAFQQMQQKLP